jgi:hypothetical protein
MCLVSFFVDLVFSSMLFEWAQVSTAGLRAAFEYWPDAYKGKYLEAVLEEQAESMRALRPFMVNGVEAMLLARLLQEGISVEDIQSSWHEQLHAGYERFESQTALEPWFERFRSAARSIHGLCSLPWLHKPSASWLQRCSQRWLLGRAVETGMCKCLVDNLYSVRQLQFRLARAETHGARTECMLQQDPSILITSSRAVLFARSPKFVVYTFPSNQ